ncbi:DUF4395 domain-containing protein [Fodinisporobacter ferrooxydans]|uniref:DUF4395 domain-containing protein n=1 Tax=Fodinisporobacter ferrooxydans TaxID=2901836 RepID=A0ABY4CDW1_9BACL|nr:DUF4395 domain-containing protein [Alicyclobacillaceae bacterium MYW30-H2]
MSKSNFIPRPLVRTNQWFIVISVISAWVSHITWILALPLLAGILGLLFDFNPVMRFAKLFLRKPSSAYIPEDRDQQKFNQMIATICLLVSLVSFEVGWIAIGYVFSVMVALAAFIAILGFCVGCFIRFQWNQYRFRRSQNLH